MDTGTALPLALTYGRLTQIFPHHYNVTTNKANLSFRRAGRRVIVALAVAIVTVILSADLTASMRFSASVSTAAVSLRILHPVYTNVHYAASFCLRLCVLDNGSKIARIWNILRRFRPAQGHRHHWLLSFNNIGSSLATRRFLLMVYLVFFHQIVHMCQIIVQDWGMYTRGVAHVKVIPGVDWVIGACFALCHALNASCMAFGGLFPVLMLIHLVIIYNILVRRLAEACTEVGQGKLQYAARRRMMRDMLKMILAVRSCFEELNELNQGILLPVLLYQAMMSFGFSYCFAFGVTSHASRYVELSRMLPPLGLLILMLYTGSFAEQQLKAASKVMDRVAMTYGNEKGDDGESYHQIRTLMGRLSTWNYRPSAGGMFHLNISLLCGIAEAYVVYFIFLAQVKNVII